MHNRQNFNGYSYVGLLFLAYGAKAALLKAMLLNAIEPRPNNVHTRGLQRLYVIYVALAFCLVPSVYRSKKDRSDQLVVGT